MSEAIDKAFKEAQDLNLEAVMIIGMTNTGGISINSSLNNVALMHWMLNKSIFDINVFERQPKVTSEDEETNDEKAA